jgi:Ca2+-binding RTX toxin-like protein
MTRKVAFAFLVLAAAFVLTSSDALAGIIRCTGGIVCYGTEQADDLAGSGQDDEIYALGGSDIVSASTGNDVVFGGPGYDQIFGEGGQDVLWGGEGNDRLRGDTGRDRFLGGSGDDFIDAVAFEEGFPEQDTVFCGSGFDTVRADRLDVFLDASCERVTRV